MHPDEAIAFGVAAQGLVIAAGAICVAALAVAREAACGPFVP